jgi:hypothetical protein
MERDDLFCYRESVKATDTSIQMQTNGFQFRGFEFKHFEFRHCEFRQHCEFRHCKFRHVSFAGMQKKNCCELAGNSIKYNSLAGSNMFIKRPQFSDFPSTCWMVYLPVQIESIHPSFNRVDSIFNQLWKPHKGSRKTVEKTINLLQKDK